MSEPKYSGKPLAYLDQNILSEFVEKITKGIDPKDIEKYIEVMHLFSQNALK